MQQQPAKSPDSIALVYVGADACLPERIRPLLAAQGLALDLCASLAELRVLAEARPPWTVLVLDTFLVPPDLTILALRGQLERAGVEFAQLVVIAHNKDIGLRLKALRAGAAAFFVTPVPVNELTERLVALCRPSTEIRGRVLIVDDEAAECELLERVLSRAGFTSKSVGEALQVLDVLTEFRPDLVLMDPHMPGANGAELTAIIREEEAFASVPILFLSAERDPDLQFAALSMGADAFINKPIRPDLLVQAVQQRLGSSRSLRQRLRRSDHFDPVTGLATRRYFISRAEQAAGDPASAQCGCGLFLVKLDGASLIDARVGTAGSELVRERIGERIGAWLETPDIATRLDHHCYAVLLQRPHVKDVGRAANALRGAIVSPPMSVGGQTLEVTVSVGIALFQPGVGDAVTAISQAEKACAEAQSAGGDRAVLYQPGVAVAGDQREIARIDKLIEQALAGDSGSGGFRLYFQPLATVRGSEPHLVEVGMRLLAGDFELVPDQDLVAEVMRHDRVQETDRWLLREAVQALANHAEAQSDLALMIPQRLETLAGKGWVLWFRDLLVKANLLRQQVIIALPAGDLLQRTESGAILLRMLTKLSIRTCLTGIDDTFVSMDLVAELHPPLVKIAQATTRELELDALIALLARLHQHGTEVIVGGLDETRRVATACANGADYLQGSLIHEPTPELVCDWDDVAMASIDHDEEDSPPGPA